MTRSPATNPRPAFEVADVYETDLPRVRPRRACKTLLEIGVARAEERELAAARNEIRQTREEQVEALLRRQAADGAEQRQPRAPQRAQHRLRA